MRIILMSASPAEREQRRQTEQREAIEDALRLAEKPLTAQELYQGLREAGRKVGLATVYRNLNRLVSDGAADTLRVASGEQAFLHCGGGHHHHLACRVCGRVEEIRDCRVLEEWTRRVAGAHAFRSVQHHAELVGVCGRCAG
jgi:Fur family transcriptional regulator, ferric uptake regulator